MRSFRGPDFLNLLVAGAGLSLILMMLVTVADVFLRNTLNKPIFGGVEIVRIALVYVVFLGMPRTFLMRSHVTVDVVDHIFGERVLRILKLLGEVASLVLLVILLRMMWGEAVDAYEMGDTTSDLVIPLSVFWAPMLLGGACSIAAVLLLLVNDLRRRP